CASSLPCRRSPCWPSPPSSTPIRRTTSWCCYGAERHPRSPTHHHRYGCRDRLLPPPQALGLQVPVRQLHLHHRRLGLALRLVLAGQSAAGRPALCQGSDMTKFTPQTLADAVHGWTYLVQPKVQSHWLKQAYQSASLDLRMALRQARCFTLDDAFV